MMREEMKASHNKQKKIAVINDFSGFGRCSLTVSLPIISHMKLQCCPLPTSIFSNHTGYPEYFFDDYTDKMEAYMEQWKKLDLRFEGIATGFLGSKQQIRIVSKFIEEFRDERTQVMIDPVIGDEGNLYSTYTQDMCQEMKKLIRYADILTPNVTEACILTDTPYKESGWHREELFAIARKLETFGAKKVVITGISMGQFIGNVVSEKGSSPVIVRRKKIGQERAGTGDVFSSIIIGDCVNGVGFETSVRRATSFVQRCMEVTEQVGLPKEDGVCFEEVLHELR